MEKVVMIIPTYNEALIIEETIQQITTITSDLEHFNVHILIFDSASQDQTQAKVKELQIIYPKLHLATEPKKSGLGSAYHQAMNYALHNLHADIVVEYDADLSHQPKYLPWMLECLKSCDVVVGSRYIPGGSIPHNWGMRRKLLSKLGNRVAQFALTHQYHDLTSGFRLTRRNVLLRALPPAFISSNYAYKIELMWRLHHQGANIQEYPIEFMDRTHGESKLPNNSIFDSLRVLAHLQPRRFHHMVRRITRR